MKFSRQTTPQPQQMVAALILTSILSVGAGVTLLEAPTVSARPSPSTQNPQTVPPRPSRPNRLPPAVLNAVREDLFNRTGIARGLWRVVSSSQQTWPNTCLGLARTNEFCGQMLVEGWRVVMSDGRRTLTYRTDSRGDTLRIEPDNAEKPSGDLPRSIADAVLEAASQRTGLSASQFRLVKAQQIVTNGCLGLVQPDEICTEIAQMGWEVIVESRQQRLVYRTDAKGSLVRLDENASSLTNTQLPRSVTDTVLRAASQQTGLPISELTLVKHHQIQGSSSCLGVSLPNEACTRDLVPLWQVTVAAGQQQLVYHSNLDGSRIRLNEETSRGTSNLSGAVHH